MSGPATIDTAYRLGGKGNFQLDSGIVGNPAAKYSLSKDKLTSADSHGKQVKHLRL